MKVQFQHFKTGLDEKVTKGSKAGYEQSGCGVEEMGYSLCNHLLFDAIITVLLTALLSALAFNPSYAQTDVGKDSSSVIVISNLELIDQAGLTGSNGCKVSDVCSLSPQRYITSTVENNHEQPQSAMILVEVRDSKGVTIFLEFQKAQLNPNASIGIGISWVPPKNGEYQLRSFAITSFEQPEILSKVTMNATSVNYV